MKYKEKFDELKHQMLLGYKRNDCRRPVKGSKRFEILVVEDDENQNSHVDLFYTERFKRMWGQHNWGRVEIFKGHLKEACEIARELKTEAPECFSIRFVEYEELDF